MGRIKRVIYFVIVAILIVPIISLCFAKANAVGNSYTSNVKKSVDTMLFNQDMMHIDRTEYTGNGMIHCVTVSETGEFAIAFLDRNSMKHIVVLSSDGTLLFHIILKEAGGIRLNLSGNDCLLNIYLVRSKIQLVVDKTGKLIRVIPVQMIPREILEMDGTKSFVKTAGDNVITYAEDLSKRSLTVKKGESIVFHQTTATCFSKPIMIAAVSALLVLCLFLKKRKCNNS